MRQEPMGIVRLALVVIGGWCVLHAMAATAVSGASAAGGKPNIVFIISDDQTFEGVGAYGNIEVKTPAIDRLAGRGAVFTHVYNMGSYSAAVCIASRTMLNTGQYVWRAQKLKLGQEREGMWSRRMSRAGYRTYMTGKWHVPIEPERVFDVVRTPRGGMPKSGPEAYNRPMDNEPDVWSPYDTSRGGFWTGGKHWSEVVADEAQVMLTEAAGRPEPFFMYIAFNAPHDPRQSPKEFVDMYPAKDIQVPPNFQPEHPLAEAMGSGRDLRDEKLAPFPRTPRAVQVHRSEYYAAISHMDSQIARIIEAVEKSGRADNTWIIFTSDHGLAVGHHGLLGKQSLYEHSLRVPFIVVGPGIQPGTRITQRVYLQDAMPTTLELAGGDTSGVAFKSLLPLLKGDTQDHYEAIYGSYLDRSRSIIEGRHKLIVYPTAQRMELFDLEADPHEMHDQSAQPQSRPIIQRLLKQLAKTSQETGDKLNLDAAANW